MRVLVADRLSESSLDEMRTLGVEVRPWSHRSGRVLREDALVDIEQVIDRWLEAGLISNSM